MGPPPAGRPAAGAALAAHRRHPAAFAEDTGQRWTNLALATAALLIVAGPWYLLHLGELQAFLADNMAQKFHGDPIGALEALYERATTGEYGDWARQVPCRSDPIVLAQWQAGTRYAGDRRSARERPRTRPGA